MRTSGGTEVADIFRQYGHDYRVSHNMPLKHLRAMGAIEACRTSKLGGHKEKCDMSRYTHRIAISNNRILTVQDGQVTFQWRDYADNDRVKVMTLDSDEFIRRFLMHVLPDRYVKIRHFGLLGNRRRKYNIALCRLYLGSDKKRNSQR